MTTHVATSAGSSPVEVVDRAAAVRDLSEQVPRLMRLVHAIKTQAARNDTGDRAALVLLFPLVRIGPLRQGALAELVHADPSTVSRHVAALVERGLVQRVADESDGRASRLHVTDAGHAALDAFRRERENHFAQVTAGWEAADVAALTTLLGRFLDDMSATTPSASYNCAPEGSAPESAAFPTDPTREI
jgi:DNA-binding MarR family transcriptional regulator